METKHTLGSWKYIQEDQKVIIEDDYSKLIAEIRGWGWIQELPNPEERQDANGKLIAAAPDLLEAALKIKSEIDTEGLLQSSYEDLLKAINKAIL